MEIGKHKKDLTNQKFGEWTVLEFRGKVGSNYRWLCRCSCGTEREVYESGLIRRQSRSCGCVSMKIRSQTQKGTCSVEGCEKGHYGKGLCRLHYLRQWRIDKGHIPGHKNLIQMEGKPFGLLTVVERAPKKPGGNGNARWKCLCQCGKLVVVSGTDLRNGTTKSCGCWHTLRHAEAHKRVIQPNYSLFLGAKGRAKERGLDFDIEQDDIQIPEICPVLGIPLKQTIGCGPADDSPTLDRIVQSKGYTKDNVWVISWKANRIKNDATLEDLEKITSALRKKMEEIHAV